MKGVILINKITNKGINNNRFNFNRIINCCLNNSTNSNKCL
jgi:hypothetical protein